MKQQIKKGVMSELIGVFVLILVIAILAGITFLFTTNLYSQAETASKVTNSATVVNETLSSVTEKGVNLAVAGYREVICSAPSNVYNYSLAVNETIASGNYTRTNCNIKFSEPTDAEGFNNSNWKVSYTYTYTTEGTASAAINATERAGASVTNYLPLLFLALIFGAILAVVLKVILPYINLGNQVGGF